MARKKYTPEEIIQHLSTVEIEQGKGSSLEEAARKVGVNVKLLSLARRREAVLHVRKENGKNLTLTLFTSRLVSMVVDGKSSSVTCVNCFATSTMPF